MLEQVLYRIVLMVVIGAAGYITILVCEKYCEAFTAKSYFRPRFPDPKACKREIDTRPLKIILRDAGAGFMWFCRDPMKPLKIKPLLRAYFKQDFWSFANSFIFCEWSIVLIAVGLSTPAKGFDWKGNILFIAIAWVAFYVANMLVSQWLSSRLHVQKYQKVVAFIGCRANAYFVLPIILAVEPENGLTIFALIVLVDETMGYLIQCFFILPSAENRLMVFIKNPPTWGVILFFIFQFFGIDGENIPVLREMAALAPWIVPAFIASNLYWVQRTLQIYYVNDQSRVEELAQMKRAAKLAVFQRLFVGVTAVYGAYTLFQWLGYDVCQLKPLHSIYAFGIASQLAFLLLEKFSPNPKQDVLIYLGSFAYQCFYVFVGVFLLYIYQFILNLRILL